MKIFSIIICYNFNLNQLNKLIFSIKIESKNIILVNNSKKKIKINNQHIKIINLGKNFGIAYAQNKGVKLAINNGADVLTFFDQDSTISSGFFKNLLKNMNKNTLSVFSPIVVDNYSGSVLPSIKVNSFGLINKINFSQILNPKKIDIIISSGSSLNIKTFKIIGFFDEKYFIDFVDTDWCLRCKQKNIPIYIMPKSILYQSIGDNKFNFLSFSFFIHNNKRIYYQIRNSFYFLSKKYVPFLLGIREILSILFHHLIIFFFVKNKIQFFKSFMLGLKDGIKMLIFK